MSARGNFWAFVAGAATGALLGVLFAPDSGKNTRDKLSYQLKKNRDKLKSLINDILDQQQAAPDSAAKTEGQRIIQDTKLKAEQLLDDVESLIGEITKKSK
jgi:gas vesicle protein